MVTNALIFSDWKSCLGKSVVPVKREVFFSVIFYVYKSVGCTRGLKVLLDGGPITWKV